MKELMITANDRSEEAKNLLQESGIVLEENPLDEDIIGFFDAPDISKVEKIEEILLANKIEFEWLADSDDDDDVLSDADDDDDVDFELGVDGDEEDE